MMDKFSGHVICIAKKSDDTTQDGGVLLELTDVTQDGEVELAFDDRNERCYVRFTLSELVQRAMVHGRKKE
jgi:hypothetical protein